MANHLRDLTGRRLGTLTVVRRAPVDRGRTYWFCICACSPNREVRIRMDVLLRENGIRNCGCLKRERAAALSRKPDDQIGYGAAHSRVHKARGSARMRLCVSCASGAVDWALKKDAQAMRVNQSGPWAGLPFSPSPDDYQPMCRSCHNSYDCDVPWRPKPRVVHGITQKIQTGILPPGAKLPHLQAIASEYGVAMNTVRRALSALIELGLIESADRNYQVAAPDGWWRF
ncbi:winged helix-turn-helix domain-containing protein [Streptomyces nigrescens]